MVYIKSNSKQTVLLPTNLRDIIPKDHICYLIEDIMQQLDFSRFDKKVQGPGNPTYHPGIPLKIIINGICERVTSTRKLEKLTYENIVFRYLAENLNPDFHTIALFRKENRQLTKEGFLQTVKVAKNLNMINFNKQILKDTNKAKKQLNKAKAKIKEEKVDKVNLTDMDSKMMKMKKGTAL
jgi:transposase